jgi:S-(hydroxymethyl)glutathione dehydrogenase / alcohol dehydrogenase
MKAAVFTPPETKLVIEEVTLDTLGPQDVRVTVEASGVCRSDLSILRATAEAAGSVGAPPMILGHEGAGVVTAVGTDVRRVEVGDRVIASFVPECGECWYCVRGESNHCETYGGSGAGHVTRSDGSRPLGMSGLGTFAEEMIVHEHAVVPVRTDLPSEQLALIGCGVTTGVGAALWTAQVKPGATVAVFGCGGVGQFVMQGARIAGAARIFAVDPVPMKREHARQAGATDLVDPSSADPVEQIREATGGRGVDYAFEVIGNPNVIMQAYDATRPRGTTVVVGMAAADATITLPAVPLFLQEKRLIGSFYGSAQIRRNFADLVALAESGQLDIGSAVSRRIRLDEVNDAFRAMEAGEVIRSVIC